jgi:hypothetical protein
MQWYYLDGQRQQIQSDESSLRQLHGEGRITAETMVWNETMTEWLPLSRALPALSVATAMVTATPAKVSGQLNPYTAPAPALPVSGSGGNVRAYAAILAQNAGWMRFLGIMWIILGGLYCLTIVGAVIGWVPIWLGRLIMRTARLSTEVEASGSTQAFNEALESLSRFFKILGILAMIGLVIGGLSIILIILISLAAPSMIDPAATPQ